MYLVVAIERQVIFFKHLTNSASYFHLSYLQTFIYLFLQALITTPEICFCHDSDKSPESIQKPSLRICISNTKYKHIKRETLRLYYPLKISSANAAESFSNTMACGTLWGSAECYHAGLLHIHLLSSINIQLAKQPLLLESVRGWHHKCLWSIGNHRPWSCHVVSMLIIQAK